MKAKQVLDALFKGVKFDTALYKKIISNNIEFMTRDTEHRHLFGSKLIGCHYVKYTMYNKNIFYEGLFGLTYQQVIEEVAKIDTIPMNFKIARDDINLVVFYIAHRFLSNQDLSKDKQTEYAKEIFNYFSYRTLVLISSMYFIYPITEEKAQTLLERLNGKYLIKKLRNWREYCVYRSAEYLESKHIPAIVSFTDDDLLPNAISELYGRTKDTLKNIYREFIDMVENDEILASKSGVMTDVEGKEVIADKTESTEKYFIKAESALIDKDTFIKADLVQVTIDIIKFISKSQLTNTLTYLYDYSYSSPDRNLEVRSFMRNILANAIEYLHSREVYLHGNTDILAAINYLVGNILRARGSDLAINAVKEQGDEIIANIYKASKKELGEKSIINLRNGLYVYIVLLALLR